ncbi:MAG: hypothetical protein ACRD59_12960 [Candidatus Acidiferrales bacterium]
MANVPFLWLAALTRDIKDGGSGDPLSVSIDVNGTDVAVANFFSEHGQAQGYAHRAQAVVSLETDALTNSSVRLGNCGDNAWAPQHALLFGIADKGDVVAIAMETDLTTVLSSDVSEGVLTIPLRLLAPKNVNTVIRRVLLVVGTADVDDAGTDSNVELQILINGNLVLAKPIPDTAQDDLEQGVSNWYYFDVQTAFTFLQFETNGGVTLTILGDDAWLPSHFFLFGLDTATGRPTQALPLVGLPTWQNGTMSKDSHEGNATITLR